MCDRTANLERAREELRDTPRCVKFAEKAGQPRKSPPAFGSKRAFKRAMRDPVLSSSLTGVVEEVEELMEGADSPLDTGGETVVNGSGAVCVIERGVVGTVEVGGVVLVPGVSVGSPLGLSS